MGSAFHLCLSSSLLSYGCSLIETMPRKFQGFGEWRFGGCEKDRYFLKTQNWQHKLIREYKRAKLASCFLDNAAKTRSYELKISENIEIKHAFQSKFFFHHIKFLYISCLSAFKAYQNSFQNRHIFFCFFICYIVNCWLIEISNMYICLSTLAYRFLCLFCHAKVMKLINNSNILWNKILKVFQKSFNSILRVNKR